MNKDDPQQDGEPPSWFNKISKIFSQNPENRDELLSILKNAVSKRIIDVEALSIIEGALQVSDIQVRDIMIPRSKMICVDLNESPKKFIPEIIETAHSRYPVVGDSKDEVFGILLAKDLLPLILNKNRFKIKDHMREVTFIPESKRLNILLNEFKSNRNHMAIVVDEFGCVSGLVTIEDILEQIVGDIEDEHDIEEENFIRPVKNSNGNSFIIKALTPINEFNNFFNAHLSDSDFDTVGGIVMQHFGYLPKCNETIGLSGFIFNILNADDRRIKLLKVTKK